MNCACPNCKHEFQVTEEDIVEHLNKKSRLRLEKCDVCCDLRKPSKIESYRSRRGYDWNCCEDCILYCYECGEDYLPCDSYVHEDCNLKSSDSSSDDGSDSGETDNESEVENEDGTVNE
jgi:hypothetical protein